MSGGLVVCFCNRDGLPFNVMQTSDLNGVRKLTGTRDMYRVRVTDYRIVYRIEDDRLIIELV